jgi:hypothetical protein
MVPTLEHGASDRVLDRLVQRLLRERLGQEGEGGAVRTDGRATATSVIAYRYPAACR